MAKHKQPSWNGLDELSDALDRSIPAEVLQDPRVMTRLLPEVDYRGGWDTHGLEDLVLDPEEEIGDGFEAD